VSRTCLVLAREPLHDAHRDLLDGLRLRGWTLALETLMVREPADRLQGALDRRLTSTLASVRSAARAARRARREMAMAAPASAWFTHLEARLTGERFDALLAFVDQAPVGLATFVTRRHPAVVLTSLVTLAQEQEHRYSLALIRLLTRLRQRSVHADLFVPLEPAQARTVVCPSGAWRDATVAAGIPASACHVVPFGVAVPPVFRIRPRIPTPARLLWAGRLSPEKGLHHYLEALPHIARETPVRLTAIASPGPEAYRRDIDALIGRLHLTEIVRIEPAVPRDQLLMRFDEHDLLLFHSVFAEPVAQVLLHAAAAGLPVVGPASTSRSLLREGQTAWCYRTTAGFDVGRAVLRAIRNEDERQRRAARLYEEVRSGHNLQDTIAGYDALLCRAADAAHPGGRTTTVSGDEESA